MPVLQADSLKVHAQANAATRKKLKAQAPAMKARQAAAAAEEAERTRRAEDGRDPVHDAWSAERQAALQARALRRAHERQEAAKAKARA